MPKPTRNQQRVFNNLKKEDPNAEVRWDEQSGAPARVRGILSGPQRGDPERIAMEFIKSNKGLYAIARPEEEFQHKSTIVDQRGNKHVRYQQMHNGLPVFGRELVVHMGAENNINGLNSKFQPRLELPESPEVDSEAAKKTALADNEDNVERRDTDPLLLVLIHEDKPYLAWHMTLDGTDIALDGSEMPAKWEYFVDAISGEVVWRYNNMQAHTRTTGSGSGQYAGTVTLNTMHNHGSNKYELEDSWLPTSARIFTHDCNDGYPPKPVSEDDNNNWSAATQDAEVDCHVYTRMVYEYFLLMHGRDSYDDAGADMHIYAHYGANVNNAYWNGSYVKIGDGDGVAYTHFGCLDMIAHEWTHAVTEYTAGLTYYGESGALNESISDVFAALIDGNWLHGAENWLAATAPASRNMADPTNGGQYDPTDPVTSVLAGHQPDHMTDKYTGTWDNAGVHINSGIMNKAAFLIATGGIHRGINICQGLGRDVLGHLYYQALTTHLISSSDFADMREAVLDSLDDLYAGDPRFGRWEASIKNAFAAVGIGSEVPCQTCLIAPTNFCPPNPLACPPNPIGVCPPNPQLACPPNPIGSCPPSPGLACPPNPWLACPPNPITLCPPNPSIACPPNPTLICPPSPTLACPPQPNIGCLPGPDPLPFRPSIEEQED